MRFYLTRTADYGYHTNPVLTEYPQLKRFVVDEFHADGPIIEINSLDDLEWLLDNAYDKIVLCKKPYLDKSCWKLKYKELNTLEIYDDYRE